MDGLGESVERVAGESGFSGVVRVDRPGESPVVRAFGLADRGHGIANAVDTRFGIASGGKGLTALAVMSLVEDGRMRLDTTARSLLGRDLPLVDDAVTVEHLLAHRSGIGDYFPEDDGDIADHVLTVPVHRLADVEQYLPVLDGRPQVAPPGERFAYCNGGYVILALLAERATGTGFHELVEQQVCERAGMHDTAFVRSDEPDGRSATGYLHADGLRTNVLHLPVRGAGDGGVHSTAADVHALWRALYAGAVVAPQTWADMVRPRSDAPDAGMRYGLGFWLHADADRVMLEGYDAGVSFRTVHDPGVGNGGVTHTVIANTSEGAWPLTRHLDAALWGPG